MELKVEVDKIPEQTSPVSRCYERYAIENSCDGLHGYELGYHEDDSDNSDSNEWNDLDDSDSDECDKWERAKVDNILPLANERDYNGLRLMVVSLAPFRTIAYTAVNASSSEDTGLRSRSIFLM